ncbi:FAD-dependent oxidoreductase [Halomonas sp. H5]|uniref:NAD(P)/FAD-dependent oxidoreductase n=1 Tax=Halomonas sp. H5 TaxID=3423910 RepID=UPI003D365CEA
MLNRDTPLYDAGLVSIEASGWRTTQASPADYPPLQEDQETDVLVVGAGLAGASLALHLAEAGVNVAILEARQPGWGASGRNAGHVLPLLKNLEVFKNFADGGRAFLEQFREHHQLPFTLSTRLGIDCDAAPVGYLHALRSKRAFTRFSHQAEGQAQQLGQRVQRLGGDEMHRLTGTRAYPYGVLHDAGGRINPYQFTLGLVASVRQLGASVFGNSEALALSRAGQRWRVETAKASILCDRVVFCTNAYATDIVPELARCYYPLTAYALTTKPLPVELREIIMPGRAVLAQAPVDLNPLVVDGHHRLITASIPSGRHPADAAWHFRHHLRWLRRTWPETQSAGIELEHYWTGRVALRDQEFPGIYEVQPGVYGLMHFNAWGNVMAPLLGMLLAQALVEDRLDRLPFPIGRPQAVKYSGRQSLLIRRFLIPAARIAQTLGAI